MEIRAVLVAGVLLAWQGPTSTFQGLLYTLPAGWAAGTEQGRFVVAPTATPAGAAVFIILYGREELTGSLDDWLGAKMTGDLGGSAKVLQSAPPTRARSGSLDVLSAGRTIQDQRGAVLLQIYYVVTDGKQAGLAMVATTSEAALRTFMPDVQQLFQSLRFAAAVEDTTKPSGPSGVPGAASSFSLIRWRPTARCS
jgi:hypothetical protein